MTTRDAAHLALARFVAEAREKIATQPRHPLLTDEQFKAALAIVLADSAETAAEAHTQLDGLLDDLQRADFEEGVAAMPKQ